MVSSETGVEKSSSPLLAQTEPCALHCNNCFIVSVFGWCELICTVILLSLFFTVKDEWPLSQWALLPVLLPAVPEPHCSQASFPAPGAHIHLSARPRCGPCCTRGDWDIQPAGEERRFSFRKWRDWDHGRKKEASLNGTSRVSVLSERTGHDGSVPRSIQPREQNRLHVHSLCS